ncbi:hypothetical protein [Streptomyces sp. NPDC095817]
MTNEFATSDAEEAEAPLVEEDLEEIAAGGGGNTGQTTPSTN